MFREPGPGGRGVGELASYPDSTSEYSRETKGISRETSKCCGTLSLLRMVTVSRIWLCASTIRTLVLACSHGIPAALARRTSSAGVHLNAVDTSGAPLTRRFCVAPPKAGCSETGPVGSRFRSSRLSEREPSQVENMGGK